ncbi:MAG: hypothetical protein HN392_01715 [Anaerolineae bacterium]|nr:hypothetical protein [Anaerolineae bacterium]
MQKKKFWWPTVLGVVSIFIGAILNLPIFSLQNASFLVIVLLVIQIFFQQRELGKIKNTKPNIQTTGFEKEDITTFVRAIGNKSFPDTDYPWLRPIKADDAIVSSSTDSYITTRQKMTSIKGQVDIQEGDTFERFYIVFKNIKDKDSSIEDAIDVHAKVEFYDKKGTLQEKHESPRWQNQPPPDHKQEKINLSASGKPEQLCIKKRKKMYVFSDASYSQDTFTPENKDLLLKDDEYRVRVVLSASNMVDTSYWFSLVNNGAQKAPSFAVIERPS